MIITEEKRALHRALIIAMNFEARFPIDIWNELERLNQMKFTITQPLLLAELQAVIGACDRKPTISILGHVLLEFENNKLTLTATDLDIRATTQTDCEADAGSICVSGQDLLNLVKRLNKDAEITGRIEDQILHLTSGKGKYKFSGRPKADFPQPLDTPGEAVELNVPKLAQALRVGQLAVTNLESRYSLAAVKFEIADGKARIVSTNGHWLTLSEWEQDGTIDVLIPAATLPALLVLLDSVEIIAVSNLENWIHFSAGNRLLSSKKMTGRFPNWRLVTVTDQPVNLRLNADEAAATLGRVIGFTDGRNGKIDASVRLNLTPGELQFSAQRQEAAGDDALAIEYAGEPMGIDLNVKYLQSAIGIFADTDFILGITSPQKQVTLKFAEANGMDTSATIMPIRL